MKTFFEEKNISSHQYVASLSDQFNRICKPLLNLGISYFGYLRIFQNGSYLLINNRLDYQKTYLSKIKDLGCTVNKEICKPSYTNRYRYFIIPPNIEQYDKKTDPIFYLLYDFNIWNVAALYAKNIIDGELVMECFVFGMTPNDSWAGDFYLNNIYLLERFCDYFTEETKGLIDTTNKKKLAYFEKQFNFFNNQENELNDKIKKYLQDTIVQNFRINGQNGNIRLSKREVECLHYLALGHSIKEIANHLDLSPRTVECYLSHTKKKTGYYNKSQLVTNFLKNNSSFSRFINELTMLDLKDRLANDFLS